MISPFFKRVTVSDNVTVAIERSRSGVFLRVTVGPGGLEAHLTTAEAAEVATAITAAADAHEAIAVPPSPDRDGETWSLVGKINAVEVRLTPGLDDAFAGHEWNAQVLVVFEGGSEGTVVWEHREDRPRPAEYRQDGRWEAIRVPVPDDVVAAAALVRDTILAAAGRA